MPRLFETGQDPRAYFVARIREQAKQENLTLTDFETRYLDLSEQGQDKVACDMLDNLKRKEFKAFDLRVSGLAWRAYEQDIGRSSGAEECYQNAILALANVDNYPNLGMFVNCIALKKSPGALNRRSVWSAALVILLLLLLGILAFLRR